VLEPLITGLKDAGTHAMLPMLCEGLGQPALAGCREVASSSIARGSVCVVVAD
jgi:hypothetical protein